MMNKTKPLVIVVSRNYSTGLGVIRALGSAGYTVDLIASTKKKGSSVIASSSRYVRNSVEVISHKIQGDSGEGILDQLMKYSGREKKPVVFSVDDFTTTVIDNNRELLEQHFILPGIAGGRNGDLVRFMNKTVQSELARSFEINVPLEWVIKLNGRIVIPEDVVYPCFVKPLFSAEGRKDEMAVCETLKELETHLKRMQEFYENREVLVQEYLDITKEYDLSGVCLDQEVIIPAIIEKTKIAKHERGVTMAGRLVEPGIIGDVRDKLISMLRKVRYVGMFDMELSLCGDKLYFNEINFRSGGPNYSYYLNGVNLPEIFVRWVTEHEFDKNRTVVDSYGKSFVYEKVAWEDFINGYMTKREMKACIEDADFTLLADDNDPRPGKLFFRRIRLSAMKHRIMKFLRKK